MLGDECHRTPHRQLAQAGSITIASLLDKSEGNGTTQLTRSCVRSTVKACGVEVLDGEREVWERQERERRDMFAEDEVKKDL